MSTQTATHQASAISELSKSTGVPQDDVRKVLEQLGLGRTIAEAGNAISGKHDVKSGDLRLSVRVGRIFVAV
jgi:hypothetical protein